MLETLVINFFEADFLLMHHQKALENYFRLSLREYWKHCLSPGLVCRHWIHHPAPRHARSTHRPPCAHSPGQLLTTTICFSGDWTTWKRQRSLHSYSSAAGPRTPKPSSYTAQPFDGSSFQLLFWTDLDGSPQLWNEWLPTTNSLSFPTQNKIAF